MTQDCLVSNLARMSDIHARIKQLREGLGLSMEMLAEKVGVSWQTVQQWENGKTAPKRKRLDDVAEVLGTTSDFLMFGREGAALKSTDAESDPRFIPIRQVEFKISAGIAGFSVEFTAEDAEEPLFLPRVWIERRTLDPETLYATRVNGSSMAPGIRDGDVIVVDTSNTSREKDAIVAVNHEGELTVKRLKYEHRRWWLTSDNADQKHYPPVPCGDGTYLLGRVVHLHREL